NVLIAVAFGALLLTWLRVRVRRMTEPLSDLAEIMSRAGQGESSVRAEVRGPAETRAIAKVFNLMIEKIEHTKELLESEVAIRTLELREARDAALQASRLKSEFLSMLTHEIRTPLTSIKGHTEFAIQDLRFIEDAGDIIKRLDVVLGTGREMLEIIDHILNYARAEAGKAEITISKVDLQNLVETVASSLQPMVVKYRNELLVCLEGEPVAELDEGKLRVILNNLLTNACKYTADGQIRLKVECGVDNLNIVVADTGIGIPESQRILIFEPFNQVDKSDAREDAGVGLGLAITKRFCEMLGGRIEVDSRVGTGSMFSVTIPLPVRRKPPMARS
ncbi:MAG: sensor histidine kinase, partial [Gammaproteobacteria bacterium]